MMRQLYLALVSFAAVLGANAQMDSVLTLISKIDFQPSHELHDGNQILLMGYSSTIGGSLNLPSPTLEFKENDSIQLDMWNLSQGPPYTIHLHGLDVDQENDGVPALSFSVAHDDTGSYIFKAPHPGTYLYHCHETSVLHVQAGMYGVIIVRPNSADTMTWDNGYSFHSERTWLMSEIDTNWHHDTIINHTYDSTAMTHLVLDYRPQHFLINGKSEHQLVGNVELFASLGEQVYLRLANIGNYGNRMILSSVLNAQQVSSDGRPLPNTVLSDTIEILPGERYGVLLDCDAHFQGTGVVEYFNLNTGQVENTQNIAVTVDGYVGISEYLEEPKMFPNPATNQLMIALPESIQEMASVTIENMLGRRVLEQKISDKPIIIAPLVSGNYIVRIRSKGREWNRKLIIQ